MLRCFECEDIADTKTAKVKGREGDKQGEAYGCVAGADTYWYDRSAPHRLRLRMAALTGGWSRGTVALVNRIIDT